MADSDPNNRELRARIAAHVASHRAEYERELDDLTRRVLFAPWTLVLLGFALSLSGYLVYRKNGTPLALLAYLPCLALLALARPALRFVAAGRLADLFATLLFFCATLSFHSYVISDSLDRAVDTAGFTVFFGIWAFRVRSPNGSGALRCALLSAGGIAYMALFAGDFLARNLAEYVAAILTGLLMNYVFHVVFELKFFLVGMVSAEKLHAYLQLQKIFYPHQWEGIEAGRELEDTMPSRTSEAVCIAFDVQDSTRIGHAEHHEFFEAVLKGCHALMMQGYDKQRLTARAYLIKELGDGFLCSIGFPFRCAGAPETEALALAEDFAEVFRAAVREHLPGRRAHCSIGIAAGAVTGFFPKAGLKQYDLFGDGIIKASRYEAVRKQLFEQGVPRASLLIVQDRIWRALPAEPQQRLQEFAVGAGGMRDDPGAKALYYRALPD